MRPGQQKRGREWGQLLCVWRGDSICIFFSIWILAVRVAVTFSVTLAILWGLVSMIFFIVSCRSISYTAVPFNLYSLGYFLKRFIEHYPKLNCIYYPLTQLLKWSTSIWLWSFSFFLLLLAFPLMSLSVGHTGVCSVLESFPAQTTQLEQVFGCEKNPSSSSEPSQFAPNNSILQKCM